MLFHPGTTGEGTSQNASQKNNSRFGTWLSLAVENFDSFKIRVVVTQFKRSAHGGVVLPTPPRAIGFFIDCY
jgi:hypothetical protein